EVQDRSCRPGPYAPVGELEANGRAVVDYRVRQEIVGVDVMGAAAVGVLVPDDAHGRAAEVAADGVAVDLDMGARPDHGQLGGDREVAGAEAIDRQVGTAGIAVGLGEIVEPKVLNPVDVHRSPPDRAAAGRGPKNIPIAHLSPVAYRPKERGAGYALASAADF